MLSARWLVLFCAAAVLPAQSELPQIKKQMQQHLSRLANLTCLETIQRSTVSRNGRTQTNDTLRLEVAFVDGKELYSRLGAGKFDDRAIGEFGRGGAIESGLFATLAQFVFMKDGPTYRYSGEETLHGRKAIRYSYEVPVRVSGYQISIGREQAIVGFSGSFWADAETLQVLRLSVHADHIPIRLGLMEANQTIDYGRVQLGEVDFLLPERAEMMLTQLTGAQIRNRTEFSHWLQYVGESTLMFEDAPSASTNADGPIDLPSGLILVTQLATEIRSDLSRVGDRITATVVREARWKGRLIVPEGATLAGRIRAIEWSGAPTGAFTLALEFSELQIGSRKARFFARLTEVKSPAVGVSKMREEGLLGIGMLQVKGAGFQLSRELRLIWKFMPFSDQAVR
jgi:hypothetical protein